MISTLELTPLPCSLQRSVYLIKENGGGGGGGERGVNAGI